MTDIAQSERAPVSLVTPTLLSFVAGYVDTYTYLALFGLFVAQVTGSFVIAGAEVVKHDYGITGKLLAILAFFVAAALSATAIAGMRRRGFPALPLMLAFETVLLAVFALMMVFGRQIESAADPYCIVAGLVAAMAMGAQSVLVRLLMRGIPQTNVMTGNMTQLAIESAELAAVWRRKIRDPSARNAGELIAVRARLRIVLAVAIGFIVGAAAGATAFASLGNSGLFVVAGILAALTLDALFRERRQARGEIG